MSDMGSNFHSFANHLGFTPEKLRFECIRNNLMKYKFKFGNCVASWKDIVAFYNKDKSLPIRYLSKLTVGILIQIILQK